MLVLPLYLLITLAIGWLTRRRHNTAGDYLNATHALPFWVVVASYLASNCGALEIVGLSAMAAQYGVQAFHFYWIGAIPAMIFLALWVMPVYRRSHVATVPEYLLLRYGKRMRLLNACVTAITLLLLAGISLYAMAEVLLVTIGLHFYLGIFLCASVAAIYVLLGGIRATIYNGVFQLLVMISGLLPLAVHNWRTGSYRFSGEAADRLHLWGSMPLASVHARMDIVGVVFGLGAVLSFGYWCTDFVQMQRAFTARTELEARMVPLWAGFGKLGFSLLVVLPGLAAFHLLPGLNGKYDQALPALMNLQYGEDMLGLGLTALAASLMSGLAANISAFAAVWTEDIYRTALRPGRSEEHYLRAGRIAVLIAIAASMSASYLNFLFSNLMEHVQLIFSIFGSPFWAVFLLGVLTRKTSERGAILGFLAGSGLSFLHSVAVAFGWLHYGSTMTSNFHAAIYSFSTTFILGWLLSWPGQQQEERHTPGILQWRGVKGSAEGTVSLWILSALLLAVCIALNIIWR
jgi:SSS family solute:Na+ symporter